MKKRLKDVCRISGKSNEKNYEKTCTFLPMERIHAGTYSSDLKISYGEDKTGYTYIRNGEVIRAIVTPCFENLKGAYIENIEEGFAIGSTELMTLSPSKINPKLLYYITISRGFIEFCFQHMKGVGGLKRINPMKSLEYPINKMILHNQISIINFLDEKCSKIDIEISLLEKKSELLEEYKQSLIFETVTKGLDKNAKMKDSGVEWIGEMPEHWTIKRVKEIAKWKNGFTPSSTNEDFYNGVDKWVTIADMQGRYIIDSKKTIDGKLFSNKIKVPSDSLLFSFKLSIGQVAFNREPLFTNEAICSFLPTSKINLNYLYYAAPIFLVKNAKKNIYNADLLNQELISNSICLFPTKEDQSKISVFLDKRTNEIEENINLINKKIELLKEYKQSLIHEAVTGQLEI